MLQNFFIRSFWFLLLVLLQTLVFNHIHFMGYATPMPYVYFLLIQPHHTDRWSYVCMGFLLGIAIDVFSNTIGAAAASMTLVGLLTPLLVKIFAPEDKLDEDFLPSAATMKWSGFLKLSAIAFFLHIALFFMLENFSLFDPETLFINIGASWVLTFLFVVAIEHIRMSFNKRFTL
ncbi:rod shape-determining protein MreD [Alloprevotella sp. OH1205_COT-284]|uniref:rod shape-determining protein MreD n=1 Tax=Alloprevotella sp. OH1205_COT-284 TaxID=2491043 RepID=UPI000F5E744E|nr:rod shape-determining protein MreD [Alloprevotella sp. OH1205_COT-284]RRD75052.1 rod shape-determining protein MreD [Alloprevotella sp. OH1205_COT-284]